MQNPSTPPTTPPKNARALAAQILVRIEREDAYSHILLDSELQNSMLAPRDRGLVTRIVYGTLAWQRKIDAELSLVVRGNLQKKTDPFVRAALRSALFQMRHLDRVPLHAIVDETVTLVKKKKGKRASGFVNAILRRLGPKPLQLPEPKTKIGQFGLRHSVPNDLARRALEKYSPEEAERWGHSINQPPPLTIRVNQSAHTLASLSELLEAEVKECRAPSGLNLLEGWPSTLSQAIQDRACMIQDEGSQLIVYFSGATSPTSPDETFRVWDVCAGQGGKSLQLLDIWIHQKSYKAMLFATDTHTSKLERLHSLVPKNGDFPPVTSATHSAVDGAPEGWPQFDLVLVDAPCSGLGVLRRHPETRWRRSQDKSIQALAKQQQEILDGVAPSVAPGGLLIYAVCTDTTEETTQQVDQFLERHPEFTRAAAPISSVDFSGLLNERGELSLQPHLHNTDGFFAVRFQRSLA